MGRHYGLDCDTAHVGANGNATELITTSKDVIALREEIGHRIAGRSIVGVELTGGDIRSKVVDVKRIVLDDGTEIEFWPYAAGRFPSITVKRR